MSSTFFYSFYFLCNSSATFGNQPSSVDRLIYAVDGRTRQEGKRTRKTIGKRSFILFIKCLARRSLDSKILLPHYDIWKLKILSKIPCMFQSQ